MTESYDALHQLISALSKPEKRYYKLRSGTYEKKSNHMKLFDAIDAQKKYDEEKIRKQFKGHPFTKQLHVTKNILFNVLLKNLNEFHSAKSPFSLLHEYLGDAEILYKKKLFRECGKTIEKGKLKAMELEKFALLLELLHFERKLLLAESNLERDEIRFRKNLALQSECIVRLNNVSEYSLLLFELSILLTKKGTPREKTFSLQLKKFIDSPLLSDFNKAQSKEAKAMFYHCHILYSFSVGKINDAYEYGKRLVELLEANIKPFYDKAGLYIVAVYNLMLCQYYLKKNKEFEESSNKMLSIPKNKIFEEPKNIQVTTLMLSRMLELKIYNQAGNFDKSLQIADELEQSMKEFSLNENSTTWLNCCYDLAHAYFGATDYRKALNYLNKIFNHKATEVKEDVQCFARLLRLLSFYEMQMFELISYNIRSYYRFAGKKKMLFETEYILIRFLRKVIKHTGDKNEVKNCFRQLITDIKKLSSDPREKVVSEYFDFTGWARRHLAF